MYSQNQKFDAQDTHMYKIKSMDMSLNETRGPPLSIDDRKSKKWLSDNICDCTKGQNIPFFANPTESANRVVKILYSNDCFSTYDAVQHEIYPWHVFNEPETICVCLHVHFCPLWRCYFLIFHDRWCRRHCPRQPGGYPTVVGRFLILFTVGYHGTGGTWDIPPTVQSLWRLFDPGW
jgi:hypothetical protein